MFALLIFAQVGNDTGLPGVVAGGTILTILLALLWYFINRSSALEKEFRQFMIQQLAQYYTAISTLEQAIKVMERVESQK